VPPEAIEVLFRGRFRDPAAPLQASGVKPGAKLMARLAPEYALARASAADAPPAPPAPPPPATARERLTQLRASIERWEGVVGELSAAPRGSGPPEGAAKSRDFRVREAREMLERKLLAMDAMEGLGGEEREERRALLRKTDAMCHTLDGLLAEIRAAGAGDGQ